MGRRKIPIRHIENDKNRRTTFHKRKNGLTKKAMELSLLCNAKIALIVYDEEGNLYPYASDNMEEILLRFTQYDKPAQLQTNSDFYVNFDHNGKRIAPMSTAETLPQPNEIVREGGEQPVLPPPAILPPLSAVLGSQ